MSVFNNLPPILSPVLNSGLSGAVNSGIDALRDTGAVGKFVANSLNPAATRQFFSGLPGGATRKVGNITRQVSFSGLGANDDWRVRIKVPALSAFKLEGILAPLKSTNGVLFPYTPDLQMSHTADYEAIHPVHTNYVSWAYKNSKVDTITVGGDFTASTPLEASYVLAVIHFFKSVTKMYYGQDGNPTAGSPPPILLLKGYGNDLFNDVPVVVTSFSTTLPKDIDYISAPMAQKFQIMSAGPINVTSPVIGPSIVTDDDLPIGLAGADGPSITSEDYLPPGINDAANIKWASGRATPQTAAKPMPAGVTRVPTHMQISVQLNVMYSRNKISKNFSLDGFSKGDLNTFGII